MKIIDVLNSGKVSVSCELFPPKAGGNFSPVVQAADAIAALRPDFMSVTYGAGGGTSQNTVAIASHIQNDLGITALAHLTCVSSTKDHIAAMLDRLKEEHIENILALRGDIPEGMDFPNPRQYRYAFELIDEIKERGDFCIGAACYPEGHVECKNKAEDLDHLKEKVDRGCDFLTTQMFFDNNVLYSFLYRALLREIRLPVIAGVMPVTNQAQIQRICRLSGTSLTPKFKAIADKFGDNPKALKQAGIAYATEQIVDLIANGVRGIHIYTMNKPDVAAKIMQNISYLLEDTANEAD